MRITNTTFDITSFFSYKDIENQYSDDFIRSNKAVIIENKIEEIKIAVSDLSEIKENFFESLHAPKSILLEKIKDVAFSEFIGSCVESYRSNAASTENISDEYSLEKISNEAPVINIINAICLEAIRKNSSDIHIQNTKEDIRIRLRIDGVLQTVKVLDKSLSDPIANRIKVMSGLNVMETRLCQDGRMTVQSDKKSFDFRVSVVPCVYGQSIVLRLFNNRNNQMKLETLGFSEKNYEKLVKSLNFKNGMILATGPTGSGKTTTLHSLISKMDIEHLKIVTIEDPVEKEIQGVDQIQVNNEIGLTFDSILRRILRQDPDVIMVGEIRDKETAELSVRAALTGHLILSTIHTNDSIGAITRLRNLGIENYLIADVLRLSLAQRLIRKTCIECAGEGCIQCSFTGKKGRTCVSEVFLCDEKCKELIEANKTEGEIKKYFKTKGFITLQEDALEKVRNKIITEEELIQEGLYED